MEWAAKHHIHIQHIQPGKPQQNTYVERYNRTVRYECLSQHYWDSIDEVQEYATQWIYQCNYQRPNMALGGITPKQRLAMVA
jgi:putative transposase